MGARSSGVLVAVALVLLASACNEPNPGVNDVLPPLMVVTGHVSLPSGFSLADTAARVGEQVLLGPPGGGRDEAIAAGRVVTAGGFYSLSIPLPLLPMATGEYEVQLYGSDALPPLAAPIALSAQSHGTQQDINGATTIVALAERKALRAGGDPTKWSVATLAALPEVLTAVPDLATQPVAMLDLASSQASSAAQRRIAAAVAAILHSAARDPSSRA